MRKILIFSVCSILACSAANVLAHSGYSTQIAQQQSDCRGVVKDANGEAIIGATVLVKGSKNGTVTDLEGNFSLSNVTKGSVIQVSYIGYDAMEKTWMGGGLTFTLREASTSLNEVVVTGYSGSITRSKLTNSISKVKNSNLTTGMFSNPAQALSGSVAGLRVIQSSGNPTSAPTIILRGGTDYDGSGSPLVVVDGMIRGSMDDINPNDIESMEVMKDAGATAIYGSRANNGVILITTKQGKSGTSKINFNTKLSWNYFNNPYEFLDAGDYLYYMRRAYQYASQRGSTNLNSLSGNQPYGTGNDYNADGNKSSRGIWGVYAKDDLTPELYNELLSKGYKTMIDPVTKKELVYINNKMEDWNIKSPSFSQDYNLSFSGGNERGHYYAGLGYNRSEGSAINNYSRRLSGLLNVDYKIKPWLMSISNVNVSTSKEQDISPFAGEANYFSRNFSYPPTFRTHNKDGELLLGKNSGDGNQQFLQDAVWQDDNWQKFNIAQDFRITPVKNLDVDFKGNWYYEYYTNEYMFHTYLQSPGSYNTRHNSSSQTRKQLTQTYNILLNYHANFGLHNVAVLGGWEYFHQKYNMLRGAGYNPNNNYFPDLEYTIKDEGARTVDSEHSKFITESYFARANYDYDGKYLASFTIRRDGISKLSKENRWGVFPGLSLGWVFSKENFMKNTASWLNFAKLRTSYGKNGNVNRNWVGNYTVQGNYLQTTYNGQQGYYLNNIPNPYLTWETSRTFEAGLDLAFLDNKVQANFTWYNRRTIDKYANITVPASSGWTTVTSNNGTFQNTGVELELNYHAIKTKDWRLDIGLNLARNTNKVIKLPANGNEKNRQGGFQVYTGNGDEKKWVGGYAEGERPGDVWVFEAEGIYRTAEEIPGNLIDRSTADSYYGGNNKVLYGPAIYESKGKDAGGMAIRPGDVKWKDVNGDGVIDNYDLVKKGNATPKWIGGFNLAASWKGITLSTRLDFALGFVQYDYRTPWIMGNAQGTYNTLTNVKDTWSEDNINAKYPTYIWADQQNARNYSRRSSMFCYKGDYLSFREVTLSYDLPKLWLAPLHLETVRVSVTGQNLGYLCEAPSMATPEVSTTYGHYPLPRMLVLGLNVTF